MRKKAVITLLFAISLYPGMGQESKIVEQISITVDTVLTAQQKVTGHMKAGDYEGLIGIKLRGNSSLSFNQKKYTIELRDKDGNESDAPLLGMPAHSDWVLLAPYNDVSAVRDPLAFQLWRDMGHWAPRTRMVELTLNGEYRGIYILSEAIKRGEQRVNIAKLKKSDVKGRDVTGGYILRIDTYDEEDATFPSTVPGIGDGIMTSQITWSCIYPKKKKLQPEQFAYIRQFVDSMEQAIQSADFADPERGYARYIDVPSFVDYFIHTELSLNADGYKRSAYFYKEKLYSNGTGGKLVAGPVWDYNLAYGNCNFCNANNPEAWCFEGGNTQPTPALWQRLLQDPAFRKAVKVRYQTLRKGVLSDEAINAYIDRHAELLAPHIARHFEKYPELFSDGQQEPSAFAFPTMDSIPAMGGFPPFMGAFPAMDSIPAMGGFPPFMGTFPAMDSIPNMGGFPPFMGAFPTMDSIPNMGGFLPFMGTFPAMDSIPNMNGFPPFMGAFPAMDSIPAMGGFPPFMGAFPAMDSIPNMGGFLDMSALPDMGGNAIGWFAAYRVTSYEEEITVLKQWLANRLAFLDRNIERFDKDWEPRIQTPKKIELPQFNGSFPFPFLGLGGQ